MRWWWRKAGVSVCGRGGACGGFVDALDLLGLVCVDVVPACIHFVHFPGWRWLN